MTDSVIQTVHFVFTTEINYQKYLTINQEYRHSTTVASKIIITRSKLITCDFNWSRLIPPDAEAA